MYSERNIMNYSLNCLVLGETPTKIFSIFYGEYFSIRDFHVKFGELTVAGFKEALSEKSGITEMNVWKVELGFHEINNFSTEDTIKNHDKSEKIDDNPMLNFSTYYSNADDNKKPKAGYLHIFIVPATGQKRYADPESIEPRKRLRSVINLDDLKELIAEIERNVTVGPLPELYPELSRNIAGRFSKEASCIPISGENFPDMRLDPTLSTAMGNGLIKLFKNNKKAFHILYAVSGAGKTRSIFEMAMHNELFVIYMECLTSMDEDRTGFESTPDTNFVELVERITEIQSSKSEDELRSEANRLIALEFTARILYLVLLEKNRENLTPRNHLLAQINGGQSCIAKIKSYLSSFEFKTKEMDSILRIALEDLKERGKPFVFAIDEASAAAKLFYPRFIGGTKRDQCRGLLTPLVVFLYRFQVPIVIAGTSFSLQYGRTIYSDIGKGSTTDYLVDFEILTVKMVESYLERFLDLSDCNLKDIVQFKILAGRPRFATRLVLEIIRLENKNKDQSMGLSKQDVLDSAVEQTIQTISGQLEFKFNDIIEREKPYDNVDSHGWKNIMDTLFIDCWFFGGYIPTHELCDREMHLIEVGIAHLLENNKTSLAIDEPLSVNVVKKILLPIYKNPDEALLQKLTAELKQKATNITDTSKGCTWQYLAQAKLMSFNGRTVADFVHTIYDDDIFEIGGIRKANLPEWTNKAIINIKSYGNLEKLSWQLRNELGKFGDDVMFIGMLLGNPKNREYMLDPNIIMRPDGVYIGNNIDHNDDYWTLLISAKMYGRPLSGKGVNNDKRTTEWKYVYYEDSESESTHQIKKYIIKRKLDTVRERYIHQGSIRIHFILPGLAESKDKSEDRGGCRVEGNDIIMYIDQNLLNKYFQNSHYVDVINNL